MVGRAGRLGFSETGKSLVVCMDPAEEYRVWTRYVRGQAEGLVSRFLSADPLLLITRVLAAADKAKLPTLDEEQVVAFIQSSFGAFQQAQRPGTATVTKETLRSAFARLVAGDLIRREDAGYRLTELGRLAGGSGVAIESIVRLANALRGVPVEQISEAAILAITQLTVELDDVHFPVHRKSHKERERWQGVLQRQVPYRLASAILEGDEATARAKKTASVLMWVAGNELREMEQSLLQHMRDSEAAGAIRAVADRTRDLLGTSVRVAEILSGRSDSALASSAESLAVQLELGVPRTLVPLARLTRTKLTRGQYLALERAGLSNLDTIAATDTKVLERVLGLRAAEHVARAARTTVALETEKPAGVTQVAVSGGNPGGNSKDFPGEMPNIPGPSGA
jgi:helicase